MAKKNNFDNVLNDIITDTRDTIIDETLMDVNSVTTTKKAPAIRKQIDPNMLIPNPKNKFSMDKDSEYEILKASIEQTGSINNDIIVTPIAGDSQHYRIVSGHRRTAIAKELNIPKVWIKIIDFENEIDETVFVIQENIGTRQKKPLDIALSIKELESLITDVTGRKRDYIAAMLGVSSKSVYNYSLLIDLPDEIISWLNNDYINTTQATAIALFPKEYIEKLITQVHEIAKDTSEYKAVIKELIKKFQKQLTKKEDTTKIPKADKTVKKVIACLEPLQEEYILPKSKKKKEELQNNISKAILYLERINEELKKEI